MSEPLVSVVISTRNRRGLLEEAIESVRNQTRDDWELVVVDDASDDGTAEWLPEVADPPRTHTLRIETHSERPRVANLGLSVSRGRCVLFLDDDDRLRPDALAHLVDALDASPGAVAAVGARERFGDDIDGGRINHPARSSQRGVWPELLAGWGPVPGQHLFRTEVVRQVGGFRPDYATADDSDLFLRIARLGPFVLVPATVLEYRVHPGQSRPPDLAERRARMCAEFIATLPPQLQRRGWRIRRAGLRWKRAELAAEAGRHARAVAGFTAAAATAPFLLRSPVIWPALAHGVVRSARGVLRL